MKLDTKPIVFLLAIVLIVCFISLFMSHKSGFEENFQEVTTNTNIHFDNIFRDMDKLKSSCDSDGKCTGSTALIDNINNNLLLLENKLNGNVKIQQTNTTFAPTDKTMMMPTPTFTKRMMATPTTKTTFTNKTLPIDEVEDQ